MYHSCSPHAFKWWQQRIADHKPLSRVTCAAAAPVPSASSCCVAQLVLLVWHQHPAQPLQHVCELHPLTSGHHRGHPEAGGPTCKGQGATRGTRAQLYSSHSSTVSLTAVQGALPAGMLHAAQPGKHAACSPARSGGVICRGQHAGGAAGWPVL